MMSREGEKDGVLEVLRLIEDGGLKSACSLYLINRTLAQIGLDYPSFPGEQCRELAPQHRKKTWPRNQEDREEQRLYAVSGFASLDRYKRIFSATRTLSDTQINCLRDKYSAKGQTET